MREKIVIALGGNALQSGKEAATAEAQLKTVKETAERIAEICERGSEIAVVHGNGPQVGRILLASETAKDVTPPMPFDVCGAMSQGYIGYHLQQCIKYALNRRNMNIPVAAVATQMIVERNDPAFKNPTKPIGPFYTEEAAKAMENERGYVMKEDAGRGWRRVVASPMPRRIVELDPIRRLSGLYGGHQLRRRRDPCGGKSGWLAGRSCRSHRQRLCCRIAGRAGGS